MLAWLSVCSEVQTCIRPSWCHCHSLSLASVKFRLVLPFWYWLARVVPDTGPLNVYVCVPVRVCVLGHISIRIGITEDTQSVPADWCQRVAAYAKYNSAVWTVFRVTWLLEKSYVNTLSVDIPKMVQDRDTVTRKVHRKSYGLLNGTNKHDTEWPWQSLQLFEIFLLLTGEYNT